jgi:hypothetical protein
MERLHTTLQENLITVLAYDETQGRIISNMLDPALMEGDYRTIAERCIHYWREYNKPPGEHTADLVADIIEDKHNRHARAITRILQAMQSLSETVNTQYVMNQLQSFNRMQRIKSAIIESADKINSQQHLAINDIEEIWSNILRTQERDFQPGTRLNDVERIIARLEAVQSEFSMGIAALDERNFRPQRGTLMFILGAAGRGKTWGLVHVGKTALLERKKVLHITIEMDEELVAQRYYQSMLKITKRSVPVEITDVSVSGKIIDGLDTHEVTAMTSWDSKVLHMEIVNHMVAMGEKRFANLMIKKFAPHTLSPATLSAYLDTLETTEKFIPDMVIVDYLGIMKVDPKNLRQSLSFNAVGLRGIAVERNMAFVSAHQVSKAGEEAPMVKTTHVSEDWGIIGHADWVLTYSCTDVEFKYGLARLYVGKARTELDRYAVLITQAYPMGQFCLSSYYLHSSYFETLSDMADGEDAGGGGEDDEGDA